MDFWAFISKPADSRAQSGVLASFFLRAVTPTDIQVLVDSNPIRDSHLTGVEATHINFSALEGMEITVVDPATSVAPSSWGELKRSGP